MGHGTGLVGEELHQRGYKNIDGIDLSADMLSVAKAKDIYGSLYKSAVGSLECKDLCVAAKLYGTAISVGVFTSKHVGIESLSSKSFPYCFGILCTLLFFLNGKKYKEMLIFFNTTSRKSIRFT